MGIPIQGCARCRVGAHRYHPASGSVRTVPGLGLRKRRLHRTGLYLRCRHSRGPAPRIGCATAVLGGTNTSRRTTTAAHHSLGSRFRSGPICHVLHRVRGNLERHRRDWRSRRGACRQEQCEWQVNAHTANPCLRTSAQTGRLLRYSCCVGGLYTRESFDWEPSTECEGCARTPSGWIVASDFRPSGQPAREQKRHRSVRLASGQMASWPANARDAR